MHIGHSLGRMYRPSDLAGGARSPSSHAGIGSDDPQRDRETIDKEPLNGRIDCAQGECMRWLFDLGKYKTIVVSVALFLIFDLGVLILNFYISSQIQNDSVAVNLSGRQRMLSQRMAKEMFLIDEAYRNGSPSAEAIDGLKQSSALFQTTLEAFENGGQTTGGDGQPVILERVEGAAGRAAIARADAVWQPILQRLKPALAGSGDNAAALAAVLPAYKQANGLILKEMNNLTTELEREAKRQATFLRMVQVIGISLATINFFIILFHFVRQLRENDELLAKAKRETDNILATVDQGLFLIDQNGAIGAQQSKALARILNQDNIAGRKLSDVLSKTLKENTRALLDDFIGILFNGRVKERLLTDINPLNQVELNFEREDGRAERRYLSFNFKRVSDEARQPSLLAVVTDVTMQTELSMELERSRAQREQDVEAIVSLMHVPAPRLQAFLTSCRESLDIVNQQLAERATSTSDLQALLGRIAKPVHRIKGDAASLKLDNFENWAHAFEDDIAELRAKPRLIGNDLLPLTVKLKSIYEQLANVHGLVDRLGQLGGSLSPTAAVSDGVAAPTAGSTTGIEALAQSVAERNGKRVSLMQTGAFAELPDILREDAESIAVQFVRNAVVHGIEKPEIRAAVRKSVLGKIWVDISDTADAYELSVQDDGAGLDFEKIRQRAIDARLLGAEQAASLDQKTLLSLIFRADFSTADAADQDAGRGVGLALVKDLIARHSGKIAVDSRPGKGSHFRILFPKRAQVAA
jgi:signal transduction histidine kinase